MKKKSQTLLLVGALCLALVGTATAATDVNSNITTSAHWTTAGNPYHLRTQIYVEPGATLTIDAGVIVAGFVANQGSLAVCRDADIIINGTANNPVIMTSANDVGTWTGSVVTKDATGDVTAITTLGDPKTGSWREGVNEWGNLTIMGNAMISGSHYKGIVQTYQDGYSAPVHTNDKFPYGDNKKQMEGLTADAPGDPKVLYGGDDDDDDSGEIHYLSIRYGGKVLELQNELNGLSLGGIGRGTDIDHVEIMNNVDDGIEIWGGTVNLKYVSIWNIGDDSFDVDEGWRGKAQFGLIVQGYSVDAKQGSGFGDNCFETDGAEDCDAQPVTTSTVYNFTVIGQPVDGDHGTCWRDNARMQYRNCIFMELGDELVFFEDDDTDGALGYSGNKSKNRAISVDGTLSWYDTWTTNAGVHSLINAGTLTAGELNALYPVQTTGKLAEITDCVFYENLSAKAYIESGSVGVHAVANNNVTSVSPNMPIKELVRSTTPKINSDKGLMFFNVERIDPLAANDALTNAGQAPNDGFFTPADFRGAFDETNNWLIGWTAADAYGMVVQPSCVSDQFFY